MDSSFKIGQRYTRKIQIKKCTDFNLILNKFKITGIYLDHIFIRGSISTQIKITKKLQKTDFLLLIRKYELIKTRQNEKI